MSRQNRCRPGQSGQTAVEYLLIISVVVVALISAAYVFVPQFRSGVESLAADVSNMLATGDMGTVGGMNRETGAASSFRGPPGSPGPPGSSAPPGPPGSPSQVPSSIPIPGDANVCNGWGRPCPI